MSKLKLVPLDVLHEHNFAEHILPSVFHVLGSRLPITFSFSVACYHFEGFMDRFF